MHRHDYAFPIRIDAASRQGGQTDYERHVEQMIRQVLLTSPGERVDLPEFGCGLRRLLFAPHSEALDTSTSLLVRQSLDRWLATHIHVTDVAVGPGEGMDEAQLLIRIEYVLLETQTSRRLEVQVL